MKNIEKAFFCSFWIAITGCGAINESLKNGTAFYPESVRQHVEELRQTDKLKVEPFTAGATGCFANSESATISEVINPAIAKFINEHNALAAENVTAKRNIGPTVLDSITGAFIWSCSYWTLSGNLLVQK